MNFMSRNKQQQQSPQQQANNDASGTTPANASAAPAATSDSTKATKPNKLVVSNDVATTTIMVPLVPPSSLPTSQQSIPSLPGFISPNNTINNNNHSSSSSNFVLPSINSNSNNNSPSSLNNRGNPVAPLSGSFSSSFQLIKPNSGSNRDIRNRLNDAKAFLDSENNNISNSSSSISTATSQPRFTLQDTQISNARPSILCPINQGSNSSPENGVIPPMTTPRIGKDRLKPFDFRSGDFKPDSQSTTTTPNPSGSFNFVDRYPSSSASSGEAAPNSLNLPISSRSSSASSVSLSSSTSSLAAIGRLEAANSDKFRDIVTNAGYLLIGNKRIKTTMDDLTPICELGSGTCGHVIKMKHNSTGYIMAVKQMSISGIVEENKRILMDLEVVLKSNDCNDIVKCLGYFISVSDVWICMELMAMCFDKLLKQIKAPIPEDILGKLTVSTLTALNYLKEQHNVIHRDVKPSNLLIDTNGQIKLCDFGISGNLINSNAFSRNNTGCAGYMAPERIDPVDPQNPVYDIRADVWSLGITLVELATGEYPYKNCHNEFEVMSMILTSEAPRLEGAQFSDEFKAFVNRCLTKDVSKRPKYSALLLDPFVVAYKERSVDVKLWFQSVMETAAAKQKGGSGGGSTTNTNDFLLTSSGGDEDGTSTLSLTPTSTPALNTS